jgi:hypothetical protein
MLLIEGLEGRVLLSADGFIKAAETVLHDGHGSTAMIIFILI